MKVIDILKSGDDYIPVNDESSDSEEGSSESRSRYKSKQNQSRSQSRSSKTGSRSIAENSSRPVDLPMKRQW